ncbi:MAG: DnaJ C-terminal domain-containing protein, partial [Candidatus Bathyarchaeia archaeon]
PRTEVCSVCNGVGAEPGTSPRTCPTCHGSGRVEHRRTSGFAQIIQVTTCNTCGGRGTVIDKPCHRCHGTGVEKKKRRIRVKIPKGIEDDSYLILRGEGEAGVRSGPPGDLYVVVHIRSHPHFRRDGRNIFYDADISFTQAALGGSISVPTLYGEAELRIPKGTQNGTMFRLRGKGMPSPSGVGDELVRVIVRVPTKLSPRQRELLEELAKEFGETKPRGRSKWRWRR